MQVDDLPRVDPDVDYAQILPIQQKRTIAFVNHFVMNAVVYLNNFAQSCESRFMEFEYKLQKVEASLLILESQLSSIGGLENTKANVVVNDNKKENKGAQADLTLALLDVPKSNDRNNDKHIEVDVTSSSVIEEGIKTCDDPRYKKFFKMLQFGVPEPAVKLKMQNEGVDPKILDTPNKIIPGSPLGPVQNLEEYSSSSG